MTSISCLITAMNTMALTVVCVSACSVCVCVCVCTVERVRGACVWY